MVLVVGAGLAERDGRAGLAGQREYSAVEIDLLVGPRQRLLAGIDHESVSDPVDES